MNMLLSLSFDGYKLSSTADGYLVASVVIAGVSIAGFVDSVVDSISSDVSIGVWSSGPCMAVVTLLICRWRLGTQGLSEVISMTGYFSISPSSSGSILRPMVPPQLTSGVQYVLSLSVQLICWVPYVVGLCDNIWSRAQESTTVPWSLIWYSERSVVSDSGR